MQAIILAAGYGRRMRPLSDSCHKALLPVGGTTILGRIVEALAGIDVSTVTVVTGYRADDVRQHLAERNDGARYRFVHNDAFAETNNIVSLALALESVDFDEDLVLVECDLLFEPGLLQRLAGADSGNVALLDHYRPGMDGTVVSVGDGIVTAVFTPDLQGEHFSFVDKYKTLNVYRFDREFARTTLAPVVRWYAGEVDSDCYYEQVLSRLPDLAEHRIAAAIVGSEQWAEVDDPNDLAVARFVFEPAGRAEELDRAKGGRWNLDVTDFGYISNVHFPTDAMLAAMRYALPSLVAGYGSTQTVLNEKLSWFLDCDPARLQVLHGASQAYPILRELFRGRAVAIPEPTFGEYPRVFPDAQRYPDAPGIDADDLERLASEVDVLVVVNPNNPTGTTLSTAALHDLARRHPGTTFLLDESFLVFSGERSSVARLEETPLSNVVVLDSLSKSLGVPGLRLGYLYSCAGDVVAGVGERLPIWNLSSPAEYLLELLLKFRPQLDEAIEVTVGERARLAADLAGLDGVSEVFPSGANFVLARLAAPAETALELRRRLLADHAVDVKDVSGRFAGGSGWIRLAVRSASDNERLVAALGAALRAHGALERPRVGP